MIASATAYFKRYFVGLNDHKRSKHYASNTFSLEQGVLALENSGKGIPARHYDVKWSLVPIQQHSVEVGWLFWVGFHHTRILRRSNS